MGMNKNFIQSEFSVSSSCQTVSSKAGSSCTVNKMKKVIHYSRLYSSSLNLNK